MIPLSLLLLSIVAYHLNSPLEVLLLVAGFACAYRAGGKRCG